MPITLGSFFYFLVPICLQSIKAMFQMDVSEVIVISPKVFTAEYPQFQMCIIPALVV